MRKTDVAESFPTAMLSAQTSSRKAIWKEIAELGEDHEPTASIGVRLRGPGFPSRFEVERVEFIPEPRSNWGRAGRIHEVSFRE